MAGLQAAFLLFHNKAVDLVRSTNQSISDEDAFAEARRLTTYHYQWLILKEFLPLFVGQAMVDDILANGRRFYTPRADEAFIPVEFQIVYRFGHSMIRPSYRANLAGNSGNDILRNDLRARTGRAAPTRSTCAAAHERPAASSAGRHSSTLAMAR